MSHPAIRARRAGYGFVFVPAILGSACGAPPPGGVAAPAEQVARTPNPAGPPAAVTGAIPCVSGTCQVQITPRPVAPRTPGRTRSTPGTLAQR